MLPVSETHRQEQFHVLLAPPLVLLPPYPVCGTLLLGARPKTKRSLQLLKLVPHETFEQLEANAWLGFQVQPRFGERFSVTVRGR